MLGSRVPLLVSYGLLAVRNIRSLSQDRIRHSTLKPARREALAFAGDELRAAGVRDYRASAPTPPDALADQIVSVPHGHSVATWAPPARHRGSPSRWVAARRCK